MKENHEISFTAARLELIEEGKSLLIAEKQKTPVDSEARPGSPTKGSNNYVILLSFNTAVQAVEVPYDFFSRKLVNTILTSSVGFVPNYCLFFCSL